MSLQAFLLDKMLRLTLKRRLAKSKDLRTLRDIMEDAACRPPRVPRFISLDALELGGVPVERLTSAATDSSRALIYLHGGGFVAGSPKNHRALTWRLAKRLNVPIYAVDYRLAPEHPFPAALDDVIAVHRALRKNGIDPKHIAIAGDSAGGNLTLAAAHKLRELNEPLPCALIGLSPVTDFLGRFKSRLTNSERDAMFDLSMFASVVPHYCPGHDGKSPLLSPLRGDWTGMPPLLLLAAESELLRDDSVELAAKARAAGVDVQLEVWPHVFHAWPVLAGLLPEAREAIERMAGFLRARL